MYCSSPIPNELLQNTTDQQAEDLIQLQADDQPTREDKSVIVMDIVKYTSFDPLNFLADAVQSQIEKDIWKELVPSQSAQDEENILY